MLTVKVPPYLEEVSSYIFRLILEDFFNIQVHINTHEKHYYEIINPENDSKLLLPSHFINSEKDRWLEIRPQSDWEIKYASINGLDDFPVFFGENQTEVEFGTDIDFPGTIFFLLNRYHEHVEQLKEEEHGRIEASDTLLVRQGLIYKPVADIYLSAFHDFLRGFINFPKQLENKYEVLPSHDVDRPFEYLYYTFPQLVKRVSGDILVRISLLEAKERFKIFKEVKSGNLQSDPYNTFEWIMTESEKQNRVSTFHFIAQNTVPRFDQDYEITNSEIKSLLKQIHTRNHKIALHPSYGSTEMESQIKKEFKLLHQTCLSLGITQEKWKSRTHYMRWNKNTLDELEKSGIDIDQSIGFPQQPGFRCGTSKEYAAFNFKTMKKSSVNIEPLILMELSLFSGKYLNLRDSLNEASDIVENLKSECSKYGGKFTFLWHNNQLLDGEMKEFYKACLK